MNTYYYTVSEYSMEEWSWWFQMDLIIKFIDPSTACMENVIKFHNYVMLYIMFIVVIIVSVLVLIFNEFHVKVYYVNPCEVQDVEYYLNRVRLDQYSFFRKLFLELVEVRESFRNFLGINSNFLHDKNLELFWTFIPIVILILIAVPSFILLYSLEDEGVPLLTLKVTGHQWYWSYEYAGCGLSVAEDCARLLPLDEDLTKSYPFIDPFSHGLYVKALTDHIRVPLAKLVVPFAPNKSAIDLVEFCYGSPEQNGFWLDSERVSFDYSVDYLLSSLVDLKHWESVFASNKITFDKFNKCTCVAEYQPSFDESEKDLFRCMIVGTGLALMQILRTSSFMTAALFWGMVDLDILIGRFEKKTVFPDKSCSTGFTECEGYPLFGFSTLGEHIAESGNSKDFDFLASVAADSGYYPPVNEMFYDLLTCWEPESDDFGHNFFEKKIDSQESVGNHYKWFAIIPRLEQYYGKEGYDLYFSILNEEKSLHYRTLKHNFKLNYDKIPRCNVDSYTGESHIAKFHMSSDFVSDYKSLNFFETNHLHDLLSNVEEPPRYLKHVEDLFVYKDYKETYTLMDSMAKLTENAMGEYGSANRPSKISLFDDLSFISPGKTTAAEKAAEEAAEKAAVKAAEKIAEEAAEKVAKNKSDFGYFLFKSRIATLGNYWSTSGEKPLALESSQPLPSDDFFNNVFPELEAIRTKILDPFYKVASPTFEDLGSLFYENENGLEFLYDDNYSLEFLKNYTRNAILELVLEEWVKILLSSFLPNGEYEKEPQSVVFLNEETMKKFLRDFEDCGSSKSLGSKSEILLSTIALQDGTFDYLFEKQLRDYATSPIVISDKSGLLESEFLSKVDRAVELGSVFTDEFLEDLKKFIVKMNKDKEVSKELGFLSKVVREVEFGSPKKGFLEDFSKFMVKMNKGALKELGFLSKVDREVELGSSKKGFLEDLEKSIAEVSKKEREEQTRIFLEEILQPQNTPSVLRILKGWKELWPIFERACADSDIFYNTIGKNAGDFLRDRVFEIIGEITSGKKKKGLSLPSDEKAMAIAEAEVELNVLLDKFFYDSMDFSHGSRDPHPLRVPISVDHLSRFLTFEEGNRWNASPRFLETVRKFPKFCHHISMIQNFGNLMFFGTGSLEFGERFSHPFSNSGNLVLEENLNLGEFRLLQTDTSVILPTEVHIRVLVTAGDVLHCWAIPSLGIRLDAVPGRLNRVSLELRRFGTFYGQCSELCGVGHGFMPITLKSVDPEIFMKWVHGNVLSDLTYNFNFPHKWVVYEYEYLRDSILQDILPDSYKAFSVSGGCIPIFWAIPDEMVKGFGSIPNYVVPTFYFPVSYYSARSRLFYNEAAQPDSVGSRYYNEVVEPLVRRSSFNRQTPAINLFRSL